MLTAKGLHIALLGVIVGSAFAYILAAIQTESERRIQAAALSSASAEHPDVSEQQILDMFEQAVAANPNDPELLERYARFLYDLGRYAEAADWLNRVIALTPEDTELQVARATALYGAGDTDGAIAEYERIVEANAGDTMALHNLIVAYLDARGDVEAAESTLQRLEQAAPGYAAIPSLRERVNQARGAAP